MSKKNINYILKYRNNRSINAEHNCIKLCKFVNNISNNEFLLVTYKKLETIFKIPEKDLLYDFKKTLLSYFNFTKGKFNKNLKLRYLFFDLVSLLIFLIWYKIFSKKINTKNKRKIFFDELDNCEHLKYLKKINYYFKNDSIFHINKINPRFDKKNLKIFSFKKFCIYDSNTLNGNFFNLIKTILYILQISIKSGVNLFAIFNFLIFRIFKYEKIFKENKSQFYFSFKFFNSSSIKNFIFKKYGGKKVSYFQKNLAEMSICFFIKTDILFSLGKGTTHNIKKLGSVIKKIIPIGSLFLENNLNQVKKNLKNKIDICNIGINWAHRNHTSNIDNKIDENYYKHIKWLKKISLEFPDLKILIKHHQNYRGDKKEINILKGSSIDIIYDEKNKNTYQYLEDSKLITSFGSTMIIESKSLRKESFFLDPNKENQSYFKFLKNSNQLRISSYIKFKNLVRKYLIIGKKNKIKNLNNFCLNSSNVSKKIYRNLISN